MKKFCQTLTFLFIMVFLSFFVLSCGLPAEKIDAARTSYAELAKLNDEIIEAHKQIRDDSLDDEIIALQEKAREFGSCDLNQMQEEEIDAFLSDLSALQENYRDCLNKISVIKAREDSEILTPVYLILENRTHLTFTALNLFRKGLPSDSSYLDESAPLLPGQILTSLLLLRDVGNTPWMLVLGDADAVFEIELPVADYKEGENRLVLLYDPEEGLTLISAEELREEEKKAREAEEKADADTTDADAATTNVNATTDTTVTPTDAGAAAANTDASSAEGLETSGNG